MEFTITITWPLILLIAGPILFFGFLFATKSQAVAEGGCALGVIAVFLWIVCWVLALITWLV